MGPIQQRFDIDHPVAAVYEAIAHPQDTLQRLPGVISVTRVSDALYRIMHGAADAPREVDLQLAHDDALRRVEWRTTDGAWSGSVIVEPIGPARTAVGVHAESAAPDTHAVSASAIHDTLQAFKHALQSREVRISRPGAGHDDSASGVRRFASDWRNVARSAFARPTDLPFALARTFSQQVDRVWEQVWRGTPMARLPYMVPGIAWNPNVEVCERDDQVRVCVDVPGVNESHLQVEIDDGYLTVQGDRQDDRGVDGGRRRSEFHYGTFTRRIPLPAGIDADSAKAMLRNGVLEVRIPLHRRAARRVPVQHAS